MNSFMRTVNSSTHRRNMLVRESLQQQLMTAVLEMQSAPGVMEGKSVEICDEALGLCSTIEAVFLHGLKDSLLNRVTEAISGPDYDAMPQPSFWGPLLVFSHRQIIDQILSLSQVTTEVGYSRAWIRVALNDGLLTSYLGAIRRDNSALKPYYDRAAFVRDEDLLEIAQRLLESIDFIKFKLVTNSSLLNFWSTTPLMMAAIWSPPMKSCPVFSAIDIAKTISSSITIEQNYDDIETASSIGSLSSFNSSQFALNSMNSVSEDEALRIILGRKSGDVDPNAESMRTKTARDGKESKKKQSKRDHVQEKRQKSQPEVIEEPLKQEMAKDPGETNLSTEPLEIKTKVDQPMATGENLPESTDRISKPIEPQEGNIFPLESSLAEESESSLTSSMVSRASETPQTPSENATYDALLNSYHTGAYQTPNLDELLDKYPIYEPSSATNSEPRQLRNFDEQLVKLPREKGLDLQGYACLECGQNIGLTFAKPCVCYFSGDYFCPNCMSTEEFLIPSRVIHNWDLKKYSVCMKAARYLTDCSTLLDMKAINPRIYSAVEWMAQLQTLRVQLNFLRAYLFNCKEPVIEMLRNKVPSREYLFEHLHQYSVADLPDIPNGTLAQQLQKIVEFARSHVLSCWLCSQKGFICEVCSNAKAIYPFDTGSTYRCGACHAVFHSECLNANKPCPKCERRRKRMDLPLLDVVNTDTLTESFKKQAVNSS